MSSPLIFLTAGLIVITALLVSLIYWLHILALTQQEARSAAKCYVVCFSLYTVGQTMVVFQYVGIMRGLLEVPSYLYALAALIFALGSFFHYHAVLNQGKPK